MEQSSPARLAVTIIFIVIAGCSRNFETLSAGRHVFKVPTGNLIEKFPWVLLAGGHDFTYIVDPSLDQRDQITVLVQEASEFCRGTRDANYSLKTCGVTPIWAFDPGNTSKISRAEEGLNGSHSYYISDTKQPVVSCFRLGSNPSERGEACTALLQYADLGCVVNLSEDEVPNLGRISTKIRAQLGQWEIPR